MLLLYNVSKKPECKLGLYGEHYLWWCLGVAETRLCAALSCSKLCTVLCYSRPCKTAGVQNVPFPERPCVISSFWLCSEHLGWLCTMVDLWIVLPITTNYLFLGAEMRVTWKNSNHIKKVQDFFRLSSTRTECHCFTWTASRGGCPALRGNGSHLLIIWTQGVSRNRPAENSSLSPGITQLHPTVNTTWLDCLLTLFTRLEMLSIPNTHSFVWAISCPLLYLAPVANLWSCRLVKASRQSCIIGDSATRLRTLSCQYSLYLCSVSFPASQEFCKRSSGLTSHPDPV